VGLNPDSLTIVVKSRTGAPFRTWSWASKLENESQHFIGKMRLGLCESSKRRHTLFTQFRICYLGEERIETENGL
jgi:hypothetical protein